MEKYVKSSMNCSIRTQVKCVPSFLNFNSLLFVTLNTLFACLCGTSTAVSVEQSVNLDGENKTFFEFATHDTVLSVGDVKNITCYLHTTLIEEDITLNFNDTGKNVLEYLPNITLSTNQSNQTFNFSIHAKAKGQTVLYAIAMPLNMTDTKNAFVRVAVHYSESLDYLSNIVGWMYFTAWSVSFYPQIFLNWRRKSVIGLHFDFLALNTVGFIVYSLFNIGLYCIHSIESEYFKRHPYGINPIQLNDVIFSIHALLACFIQIFQCFIYERGDQKISKTGRSILGGIVIFSIIFLILGSSSIIVWLDFLYVLSYIKLFITLIKYIPQAYFNYVRKSTSGWSIGNIILDFTGGSLSIFQMFIISYNYDDWSSVIGDPAKFGLGLFSIMFDIFFMTQHYILYNGYDAYQLLPESPPCSLSHQDSLESNHGINYGSVTVDVY